MNLKNKEIALKYVLIYLESVIKCKIFVKYFIREERFHFRNWHFLNENKISENVIIYLLKKIIVLI